MTVSLLSVIVPCPHGTENRVCYRNGTSANGQLTTCDRECLGGCNGPSPDNCFACANARIIGPNDGCRNQCPSPSLLVRLLFSSSGAVLPDGIFSSQKYQFG
jgi:hypothetical protein